MAKKITKKELKALKASGRNIQATETNEPATSTDAFKNERNIMWVILSAAMAMLVSTLLLFPQNLGAGITSVYSVMLWWGLFAMFLFRYIGKKGVIGFISGSVFGMVLKILSPLFINLLT